MADAIQDIEIIQSDQVVNSTITKSASEGTIPVANSAAQDLAERELVVTQGFRILETEQMRFQEMQAMMESRLVEREKALCEREKALCETEKALTQRAHELDMREDRLDAQKHEFAQKKFQFEKMNSEINQQFKELQQELERQALRLNEREKKIKDSATFEQKKSTSNAESQRQEQMLIMNMYQLEKQKKYIDELEKTLAKKETDTGCNGKNCLNNRLIMEVVKLYTDCETILHKKRVDLAALAKKLAEIEAVQNSRARDLEARECALRQKELCAIQNGLGVDPGNEFSQKKYSINCCEKSEPSCFGEIKTPFNPFYIHLK